MNQLITEDKFIEGIKQSILYGNREFLRSFQLRLEIKECNSSNSSNQDKNTVDTTVACLAPPFQNIGFLETKWLEIIKELVQHGNKNILKNVELQLVMEERTDRVDSKKKEKGKLN